jgi:hypothetical protein
MVINKPALDHVQLDGNLKELDSEIVYPAAVFADGKDTKRAVSFNNNTTLLVVVFYCILFYR